MSRDLKAFVWERSGTQPQSNPATAKHLENRRALAEFAKVKPKATLGQPAQPHAAPQSRPPSTVNPATIHPALVHSRQRHNSEDLGAFAETTLGDDSDDVTVNSARDDDEGDRDLEYQQNQWFYKTEDEFNDGERIGERIGEVVGNMKNDDQRWDRQGASNGNFQLDRSRFQTSPERNPPPMLSVSQQALFHDLRQQNPRIAQILVEKEDKEIPYKMPNQGELPFPTQSRKSGRFEHNPQKAYTSLQQMHTGQAGATDGHLARSHRHDVRNTHRELDTSSPGPVLPSGGGEQFPAADASSEFSYDSSLREPSPSDRTPRVKIQTPSSATAVPESTNTKRAAVELDYDENTLFNMKYSELHEQAFDTNPKSAPPIPVHPAEPRPLPDRLKHFASLGADSQTQFFAQLPKDEWDNAGDWFINSFADIMGRLRRCRDAKREISKEFEDELAAREERLQARNSEIDETLRAMKRGGESVLMGTSV